MTKNAAIAVVGTFDSKGEEHLFLKERIEVRGVSTLTINVGTKNPSSFRQITICTNRLWQIKESHPRAVIRPYRLQ